MSAFKRFIYEVGLSIFFNASNIARLRIDGHTLDIRFTGLINLRLWIIQSLILIYCVCSIKLSRTCLLDKNMRKRLLDFFDTKIIFIGLTIFPIASTYSFWRIPSIEINTIAFSLFRVLSVAVIVAKLMLIYVSITVDLIR